MRRISKYFRFVARIIRIANRGESAIETASGITLLLVSPIVLLYGSYVTLFKPAAMTSVKNIKTHEDYKDALIVYRNVKVLKKKFSWLSISWIE